MNAFQLTAPCGLDCFNCPFLLAREDEDARRQLMAWSAELEIPFEAMLCDGCRAHDGRIPTQRRLFGEDHRCAAYECAKDQGLDFCGECRQFPCDHLHPFADRASVLPHNLKVFNLCLINRLGLEEWARSKAAEVRETYFRQPWRLHPEQQWREPSTPQDGGARGAGE